VVWKDTNRQMLKGTFIRQNPDPKRTILRSISSSKHRNWRPPGPIDPYSLCVFVLIAFAITIRLLLISDWPVLNSDEGTMGLMALHIIKQGKIPLFFYGQGYVGSLEALLASPLFLLFGASRFTLRLSNVLLYTFFLLIMYKLTSILFSKRLALFTLLVLCFGSDGVLSLQLSATGGHPDMLCVGSGLLLYTLILVRTAREAPLGKERRGRVMAYAGWGLLAGLALWVDPLLFPYVVLSGCLLWRFCFYELRGSVALYILGCFFLPLLPGCIYDFSTPITSGTFSFLGAAYWIQGTTLVFAPPLVRIAGMLFVALPRATGGTVFCNLPPVPVSSLFIPQRTPTTPCNMGQNLWGIGFFLLMLITAFMAFITYQGLRRTRQLSIWTLEERQAAIGAWAQISLVGSPFLILLVYATTSSAGFDPWYSARYLTSTLIALPAVLWPLWKAGAALKLQQFTASIKMLGTALLLAVFLCFTLGWIQTLHLIPAAQEAEHQEADLIHTLLTRGITHIYTDYWTCDRLAFESTEHIICSVVDEHLQPGVNRYSPYTIMVKRDAYASWVLPLGSPQAQAFEQYMQITRRTNPSFTRDGYVIYLPLRP